MKALLDTHTFIWWIIDDERLSRTARKIIESERNDIYLSAASCWEIVIKAKLGKIELPRRPDQFIAKILAENKFLNLPVIPSHALNLFNLPDIHRDPFDRMLLSQSKTENMPIITSDELIVKYPVNTIW